MQAIAAFAQAGGLGTSTVTQIAPAAFNRDDAANYCGFSRSTLLRFRDKGWVKPIDVEGRPKYRRRDLDKLLDRIERNSGK